MKRDASSPEAYRESLDVDQRALLDAIREAIFAADPKVVEGLRYGMLDYPGLANLAAQKHYVSLYVVPEVLSEYAQHFDGVARGKSCLRFTRLEQVDAPTLVRLLGAVRDFRERAAEASPGPG